MHKLLGLAKALSVVNSVAHSPGSTKPAENFPLRSRQFTYLHGPTCLKMRITGQERLDLVNGGRQ